MKCKLLYPLIAALVFPVLANGNFRDCEFGMSVDDVFSREGASLVNRTSHVLHFSDRLFGFETQVSYLFSVSDELFSKGMYTINATGCEIEEILDHYTEVVRVMNQKHGPTMTSGVIWRSKQAESHNDIVNSFRFGDVRFRHEWYGKGVHVQLNLSNELNTRGIILYTITYVAGREFDYEADSKKL